MTDPALKIQNMRNQHRLFILLAILLISYSCEYSKVEPISDCNQSQLVLNLVSSQNANCGAADGSLEVQASAGVNPYEYSLDGQVFQESGVFNNLASGNYEIQVRDANGCISSLQATVENDNGLSINASLTDSGCGSSDGEISIVASGGSAPYTFSLNGGAFGSSDTFSQLSSGDYTVVAKDNTGCEVTQSVTVLNGTSFSNRVSQIISTNCAISGCHAGSQSPDLRNFSNIKLFADRIRLRTSQKSMPPGGGLSDAEIAAIACWVNDGALNN